MKKLIVNPVIEYMKFRKLREAKRSGKIVNEVYRTLKRLSIDDDKRVWKGAFPLTGSQASLPIILDCEIQERQRKKNQDLSDSLPSTNQKKDLKSS